MNYVLSDLHGCFDLWKKALEEIKPSETDIIYVLGDVLDRGEAPIELIEDIMNNKSVQMINGNHELDFLRNHDYPFKEKKLISEGVSYDLYLRNGGKTTMRAFLKCDSTQRQQIVDFINGNNLYFDLGNIVMIHGGIENYETGKPLDDYTADQLTSHRYIKGESFFKDKLLICGHTPTLNKSRDPAEIFFDGKFCNIDCGCAFPQYGGRLAVLRTDDMKVIYVTKEKILWEDLVKNTKKVKRLK